MSIIEDRAAQAFPVLDKAQLEVAGRFAGGPARRFGPSEEIYAIGAVNQSAWLVLEGSLEVHRREGLGRTSLVHTYHAGELTGEVNQLTGRPTLASLIAGPNGAVAMPFDAAHIRALAVGAAELGEIVMRAFILRRVALIEAGAGSVIIGHPGQAAMVEIQNFLTRSGFPHLVLDADKAGEGHDLVVQMGVRPDELPLIVCPNGTVLRCPTTREIAACLGMTPEIDSDRIYDVAIVGAGPAGLAAAVYAASEGLSVLVLDSHAFGGQAGASMRIENYLGFPTGISGQALAGRAYNQALKFGAEMAIPRAATRMKCSPNGSGDHVLLLDDGTAVTSRTVIIASGAHYRRPEIADIDSFDNSGISYWASPVEAMIVQGRIAGLVGGGNSAGQAAVFLAGSVKHLAMFARRPLEQTMSRYLIDRIESLPNITVHIGAEIEALEGPGDGTMTAARFREMSTGKTVRREMEHLFVFIGAEPNADWTDGCVAVDKNRFILTGRDLTDATLHGAAQPLPLETSMPGVFGIGDVRSSSVKRVAAAVGEGAAVVAQIHGALTKLVEQQAAAKPALV